MLLLIYYIMVALSLTLIRFHGRSLVPSPSLHSIEPALNEYRVERHAHTQVSHPPQSNFQLNTLCELKGARITFCMGQPKHRH